MKKATHNRVCHYAMKTNNQCFAPQLMAIRGINPHMWAEVFQL